MAIRIVTSAAICVLLMVAGTGCGSGHRIAAERNVFHAGLPMSPRAVKVSEAGDIIVAGSINTAAVAFFDSRGDLIWKYTEPRNNSVPSLQSQFNGIVELANHNFLLCGSKWLEGTRQVGMLMTFDRAGRKLEERFVAPKDNPQSSSSEFSACTRGHGGIVVFGMTVNSNAPSSGWLVSLDANGLPRSEKIDTAMFGTQMIAMQNSSLLISFHDLTANLVRLIKVDEEGNLLATRDIHCSSAVLLTGTAPSAPPAVMVYDLTNPPHLFRLSSQLTDLQPPTAVRFFDLSDGIGVVRADGTAILYGRTGSAGARASIALDGATSVYPFGADSTSYAAVSAVFTSDRSVISARTIVSADPSEQGLMLTWDEVR